MTTQAEIITKINKVLEFKHSLGDISNSYIANLKNYINSYFHHLNFEFRVDKKDKLYFLWSRYYDRSPVLLDSKFPNYFAYPYGGIDLSFYVNVNEFSNVKLNEINNHYIDFKYGANLLEFVDLIENKDQVCGTCAGYAASAILSYYYYKEMGMPTINNFFIDPLILVSCTSYKIQVESDLLIKHKLKFPKSNGYYTGHGCMGNILPEILFWASENTKNIE